MQSIHDWRAVRARDQPVTKTNWEGIGVEPDVKAPADDALTAAVALASKAILDRRAAKPSS
jgi:hypothetical protein